MKKLLKLLILSVIVLGCGENKLQTTELSLLKISENKRFITNSNGDPVFWLGDTGWLLFKKTNRNEAEKYLEDRRSKGFNVIQIMVVHDINDAINFYGDSAFVNNDIARPLETPGNNPDDESAYDFWDHTDYIIDLAGKKGIYMALVPIWGSNIKGGPVDLQDAEIFGIWLAERYKDRINIVWLNGGDISGADSTETWKTLGNAIHETDSNHLITFHPRGRMQSSMWFHNEPWLDFNMIQSGHRRYDQDDTQLNYGEDNWRYVKSDYKLNPLKPTIDGEPSYEGIPQGLHDTLQPYWNDNDVRRYAYWSVFAGAFGFTYGHNSVMQFYRPEDTTSSYGPKIYWEDALNEPGAQQMIYLKELMLSRSFLDRIPDQSLIHENQGERYNYLAATRGKDYAFIYTYTGREIPVALGKIEGKKVKASWYNPLDGSIKDIGVFDNSGNHTFKPEGEIKDGNDWVLILDSI